MEVIGCVIWIRGMAGELDKCVRGAGGGQGGAIEIGWQKWRNRSTERSDWADERGSQPVWNLLRSNANGCGPRDPPPAALNTFMLM